MSFESSPRFLSAAAGKTIKLAQIVNEASDVHGVLLVFSDGTELSIDFYPARFEAEVRHYQWSEGGEASTVEPT